MRNYKFGFAFENSPVPRYTTERLLEDLQANTVPIHRGDSLVGSDFNTRRFLKHHNFATESALVDQIIELDTYEAECSEVLRQPWFAGIVVPTMPTWTAYSTGLSEQ